jgi:hypothetical protein
LAWFSQLPIKNAKCRAFCKDLAGLGLKRLGKAAHSAGLADNQPPLNLFCGPASLGLLQPADFKNRVVRKLQFSANFRLKTQNAGRFARLGRQPTGLANKSNNLIDRPA